MIYGSGVPSSVAKSGTEYTNVKTGVIYIQKDNPSGNNWEAINSGTQTVSTPNTFFHCKTVTLNYNQIISASSGDTFEILRINSGENGIINLLNVVSAYITPVGFNNITANVQIYDFNTSKVIAQVPGSSGIFGSQPLVNYSVVWRNASSLNQSSIVKLSPNEELILYYNHSAIESMVGGHPDFKSKIYFIYTIG